MPYYIYVSVYDYLRHWIHISLNMKSIGHLYNMYIDETLEVVVLYRDKLEALDSK